MATTVTYKGQVLVTVDNSTKVLETSGTWCEDDFTLVDVSGGGSSVDYSFMLKDYEVSTGKWAIDRGVLNYIKTGGCLHIIMDIQQSAVVSGDREVLSFGADALTAWAPSTNCSVFGMMYNNKSGSDTGRNHFALRVRGSSVNATVYIEDYADIDTTLDIKLYSDRLVNVKTGNTYYYSQGDTNLVTLGTAMTNLCSYSYISVGCNQSSNRWSGNIVDLFAIEDQ